MQQVGRQHPVIFPAAQVARHAVSIVVAKDKGTTAPRKRSLGTREIPREFSALSMARKTFGASNRCLPKSARPAQISVRAGLLCRFPS